MENSFDQEAVEAKKRVVRKVRQDGIEEGRWEGRQEGIREGQVQTILKVAYDRFGAVPQNLETLLHAAAPREMDNWIARISTAANIEEAMKRHWKWGMNEEFYPLLWRRNFTSEEISGGKVPKTSEEAGKYMDDATGFLIQGAEVMAYTRIRNEGIQEGVTRGQGKAIQMIAQARFGMDPQKLESVLYVATPKELDDLTVRVGVEANLEGVLKGYSDWVPDSPELAGKGLPSA